jgi:hypothetical protein
MKVNMQGKGIIIFRPLQSNENNSGEYNKRVVNLQKVGIPGSNSVCFCSGPDERRSTQMHISVFICIYPGQKILPG